MHIILKEIILLQKEIILTSDVFAGAVKKGKCVDKYSSFKEIHARFMSPKLENVSVP